MSHFPIPFPTVLATVAAALLAVACADSGPRQPTDGMSGAGTSVQPPNATRSRDPAQNSDGGAVAAAPGSRPGSGTGVMAAPTSPSAMSGSTSPAAPRADRPMQDRAASDRSMSSGAATADAPPPRADRN